MLGSLNPMLPTLPVADILIGTQPPVSWLIPEFIPRSSLIALAGSPGTGKSVLAYTIAIGVATGTPFLGYDIHEPRKVLYFDQENSISDCSQYLKWAWIGLDRPNRNIITTNLSFVHFQLGGPDWAQKAVTHARDTQPDLIIIDTTTPACYVQDENDNAEAAKVIAAIRQMMAVTNPTSACIALKHAKVDREDGHYTLRGAKAWEGSVDSIIYQIKTVGAPRSDGLSTTRLNPAKTRAFGLRDPISINPSWVGNREGLKLNRGRN